MTLEEIVAYYVQLRDKKASIEADSKAKVAKINEALNKLEGIILKTFDETGMESAKTAAGTAYKSTQTKASVADRDAFFAFVKDHDAWEMLPSSVNKTAVAEYKAANDDLPPGVNWREEVTIGVRRA